MMRTKSNNLRSKGGREAIRTCIIDHYVKGFSYREIQNRVKEKFEYNLSLMTISRDVRKALTEWREQRHGQIDDLKTIELQRVSRLESVYWDAWERSLAGNARKTEKQKAMPLPAKVTVDGRVVNEKRMEVFMAEKSTMNEETFGDPRFLAGIQWCIEMRCKILQIEKPVDVVFNQTNNTQVNQKIIFKAKKRLPPVE